ncbi:hypothetical protein [Roseateles sp.]|uniref:hypothetical protein n=1 Tax=Roseateles sp. TaxID=1971397 RepID=UPI0031D578B6
MNKQHKHPYPDAKAIFDKLGAKPDVVAHMVGNLVEIKKATDEAQASSDAARAVLTAMVKDPQQVSIDLVEATWACLNRLDAALKLADAAAWRAEQGPLRGLE